MVRDEGRLRAVRRVLLLALAINLATTVSKLGFGYWTNVLGLVADGYHSLLDAAASVLGLVGVTLAAAPPDEDHQYGHRKFEVLSAMGISMFIFLGAFEVLREAYGRLVAREPAAPEVSAASFAISVFSLVSGLLLSRYEARRGRELQSPVLNADADHTWSDVFATVVVLVGLAVTRFVHPMADALVALGLGSFLVRVGYNVLIRGLGVVSDRAVLDAARVDQVARSFPAVRGTARIRSRGEPEHVFLDMVILVQPDVTVATAHELVDQVEEKLGVEFPGLRDIVIHVEPAPAA
jgi:cation diffusion facilitator family transporter